MIRGIIFDFDGLLVDTEGPALLSWQELYAQYDQTLTLAEWAACLGTAHDVFDPCLHLERLVGRPLDHSALRAWRKERKAVLSTDLPLLPGVADLLAAAQARGLRLAVASSSGHAWVDGHLERLGLRPAFAAVVCAEDVARVKPDPALYRTALARLGLAPHEAFAVEDSPNGVRAAQAAGLICVAVPNALTGQLPLDHADLVLPTLDACSLNALLSQIAACAGMRKAE